jgi:hypothetical protein
MILTVSPAGPRERPGEERGVAASRERTAPHRSGRSRRTIGPLLTSVMGGWGPTHRRDVQFAATAIPPDLARAQFAWHTDLRRADVCTVATCTTTCDLLGLRRLGGVQSPGPR